MPWSGREGEGVSLIWNWPSRADQVAFRHFSQEKRELMAYCKAPLALEGFLGDISPLVCGNFDLSFSVVADLFDKIRLSEG